MLRNLKIEPESGGLFGQVVVIWRWSLLTEFTLLFLVVAAQESCRGAEEGTGAKGRRT
jgi:hypothetical protein